ncbi:hypothetical protein AAFM46_16480 (plasmid) [Arthrobacter sp. TMP15]|uniref:hypothetical protein n=1 Tax=Arthrobacter sp. TMP15 TaxID=3140789 RepID=UPI0031BA679E
MEIATGPTLKRLARTYVYLDEEINVCDGELEVLVAQAKTALHAVEGVFTVIASQLLITAGDNSQRLHSQAACATLCGVSPFPASS